MAEGLCRLLGDSDIQLILIDYDRVERHNLVRQNFFAGDIGEFKSKALAERLSRLYGRKIGYSVYPYDPDLALQYYGRNAYRPLMQGLMIGCVDGAAGREALANTRSNGSWWLDAGNGQHSGQILLGNVWEKGMLNGGFDEQAQVANLLPMPHLWEPSLLIPPTKPEPKAIDCAEAVELEEQSPVINQQMATMVLNFVYRFLTGTLTWMGAYIDLDSGSMQTIPADPVTVARKMGMKVDRLMDAKKRVLSDKHRALVEV